MTKTPIEWTDFTVNPFRFRNLATGKIGHHCTKISPGCKNCYAGKMQAGPYLSGLSYIAENKAKGEFFLDEAVLERVLRRRKPARIFWCDMTDMFLDDYPDDWIDRCFAVMALTPHLTHQVLTKRARRMLGYCSRYLREATIHDVATIRFGKVCCYERKHESVSFWVCPWPLPNVYLGVSVEDQQRKDRIDLLRQAPAAIRFLSLEPLLEDLGTLDLSGISWCIAGGESGPGARPCDLAWIRSIRDQCAAARVRCFVKQVGSQVIDRNDVGFDGDNPRAWPVGTSYEELDTGYQGAPVQIHLKDRKGGDSAEWPEDLRVRQMPEVRR
jgi:protein gp37